MFFLKNFLSHLVRMLNFYTPKNIKKPYGFLLSGGIEI